MSPENDNALHNVDDFHSTLQQYQQQLVANELPVVYSLKHFANWLGISHRKIVSIIRARESFYNRFLLRKKRKGTREIMSPKSELKSIQRFIYETILSRVRLDESCYGFRKNVSIKHNALHHVGQEVILKIDLYRFFDTITEKRVYGMFTALGYHPNLAVYFAKLLTVTSTYSYKKQLMADNVFPSSHYSSAVLPQGSPASPAVANIIATKLDIRLRKLSARFGVHYSRYADDLVFSGQASALPPYPLIKKIIEEEGFFVNKDKIAYQKQGTKQIVTGLLVSERVTVTKTLRNEIRKHIYYAGKKGVQNHLEWLKEHKQLPERLSKRNLSSYREWLLGKIFFVRSIDRTLGDKFLDDFQDIDWPV